MDPFFRRKITDRVVTVLCVLATLFAVVPLVSVLVYVGSQGVAGLSGSFFTSLPKPVGEAGGGMANAIVGSLVVVGIACAIGIPLGIAAGVYVSEFEDGRFARMVRFSADVLGGVPSIVVGIFVYALIVVRTKHFSAWAGGRALAVIMLPTIVRTTEELLRLVPASLREAALALGVPKWKTTIFVVLRTALPGIATGVMLAVARVAGETAPLLFTAFNNRFWAESLNDPTATLPVQIFTYSVSPYDDWQKQAWAGALTLVALVLVLNLLAKVVVGRRARTR